MFGEFPPFLFHGWKRTTSSFSNKRDAINIMARSAERTRPPATAPLSGVSLVLLKLETPVILPDTFSLSVTLKITLRFPSAMLNSGLVPIETTLFPV